LVYNNNQDKQPLKLPLTAEEKGRDWRGRKRTGTEGERVKMMRSVGLKE